MDGKDICNACYAFAIVPGTLVHGVLVSLVCLSVNYHISTFSSLEIRLASFHLLQIGYGMLYFIEHLVYIHRTSYSFYLQFIWD